MNKEEYKLPPPPEGVVMKKTTEPNTVGRNAELQLRIAKADYAYLEKLGFNGTVCVTNRNVTHGKDREKNETLEQRVARIVATQNGECALVEDQKAGGRIRVKILNAYRGDNLVMINVGRISSSGKEDMQ
jgi:hypothetical protein